MTLTDYSVLYVEPDDRNGVSEKLNEVKSCVSVFIL